jgi:cellulose synthase/poly-beta-1,6-N-acetylglucosamine synthase-like glycosyltransferase
MELLQNTIMYSSLFVALYFQVFLFLTFIGWRTVENDAPGFNQEEELPTVTIMIPCWNEETTVEKTIESLLELE